VLFVASDFTPSSTQYVTDPRYFLKSCFVPVLEPRTHQEMLEFGPLAARLSREHATPVAVLASGLLCHSEGLVRLPEARRVPRLDGDLNLARFMNLPRIARENYDRILAVRMPGLRAFAEETDLNRIEWNDRSLGVIVHGVTELHLREAQLRLPVKPSMLSLGMTSPVPRELVRRFLEGIEGRVVVLGDGLRFLQEELLGLGLPVEGKAEDDPTSEWSPDLVARRLGAEPAEAPRPDALAPVVRPPNICAGCPYRAFGLVVQKLRKRGRIVGSFGDIGCNTLLYFLQAIDTCTCMGASDAERQGAVLSDPSLAGKVISVIGDSTECHSGLDATRNAVFRNVPGVKVVLDNRTTAMTGGQPAPSSPTNLAGEETAFDLVAALEGEGADVELLDAYDMRGIERSLRAALKRAGRGEFTVLVIRGPCMRQTPESEKRPRYRVVADLCENCDLCLVCPGIEKGPDGSPRYTHLCVGCGGHEGLCHQRCARDAIVPREAGDTGPEPPPLPDLPEGVEAEAVSDLPSSIRVAVRGVGGQGNLFLGKVLAEVALLAGYENVVKGETHGMAQLGGPVISSFSCGAVHSPTPGPTTVDVLVALEQSEILRPGFLELLRPGGTVLLNRLCLVPAGVAPEGYPDLGRIRNLLGDRRVVEIDALAEARSLGDEQGRTSNVVALGALSTLPPLSRFPLALWRKALLRVSPTELLQRANTAAFLRGREVAATVTE
jgi:indolepyruvate ferredoxin oxidoreductase alpha subunit